MSLLKDRMCPKCEGYGLIELEKDRHITCPECKGSGIVKHPMIKDQVVDIQDLPNPDHDCPVCEGNGVVFVGSAILGDDGTRVCPCCNGTGAYPSPAEIICLREELNQLLGLRDVQNEALLDNMVNILSSMFITSEGVRL